MSAEKIETENITSADKKNDVLRPGTTETAGDNELKVVNKTDKIKIQETGTGVPNNVDEIGASRSSKAVEKMDLDGPTDLFNDDEEESTDVFSVSTVKNHSLEMKLSAIIEKACSSDLESEDFPELEPKLTQTTADLSLATASLLSVLEDPAIEETVSQATNQKAVQPLNKHAKKSAAPRRVNKKYVYRLKSKSGKILRYSSNIPIVLKKPHICLTKINVDVNGGKSVYMNGGGDASVKQSHVKKKSTTSSLVNGKRGKDRRSPATKKLSDVVIVDDAKTPANTSSEQNSSFGMQTRKRKLKFTPDGRVIGAGKRQRGASSSSSEISDVDDVVLNEPPPKESSDEDWQVPGEDTKKPTADVKMSATAAQHKVATKLETTPSANSNALSKKTADILRRPFATNNKVNRFNWTAPKPPPSKLSVDPSRLLSSLVGANILPSQLNVVRFKPKTIHARHPLVQKKVTIADDLSKMMTNKLKTSLSTKATTPKSSLSKILPMMSTKASPFNETADTKSTPPSSTPLLGDSIRTSFKDPIVETAIQVPSFDDFTDSRTVRTKAGPKKLLLQKLSSDTEASEKLSRLTVYDIAQNVFDRMPSWNLHLIPDTNTFCLAQIGRGRMGIPILKKSIELSDNFAAKIYVHQLHCKKYDGVYDTESKIFSLIGEIDTLAA